MAATLLMSGWRFRPGLLLVTVIVSGCGGGDVRDAVRAGDDVRTGQVGRAADGACRRAAEAIPAVRGLLDEVRQAALRGDASRAKSLLDNALQLEAAGLEFKARVALRACRTALG